MLEVAIASAERMQYVSAMRINSWWHLLVGAMILLAGPLRAQRGDPDHIVIEPSSVCVARPDSTAPISHRLAIGDVVELLSDSALGPVRWAQVTPHGRPRGVPNPVARCWVRRDLIMPFDEPRPEGALIALSDRILSHQRSFVDYVDTENLLAEPYAAALAASGRLQYRRLLLIKEAEEVRRPSEPSTLGIAWRLGHDAFLRDNSFGLGSTPQPKSYWDLFERYKSEPWVDDLAWSAAQLRPDADECYAECVLQIGVREGPMQYWTRLPEGRSIVQALELGIEYTKYAAGLACFDGVRGAAASDYGVSSKTVIPIRTSLNPVKAPEKTKLLALLAEIEAKCRVLIRGT